MADRYEKLYTSKVAKIAEDTGLSVELQAGTKLPTVSLSLRYVTPEGDWGYCSPRNGAKQIRIPVLTSKTIGWIIAELTKIQAVLEKKEKEAAKTTVKKAVKAPETVDLLGDDSDDDEIQIVATSSRTRKTSKRGK